MAEIIITEPLLGDIQRRFSTAEANTVIDLMEAVGEQPRKGKTLSSIGGIVIKQLKYKKYRFYFITDGHVLKFGTADELASLLIKFVKMSDKKDQQKTIDKIKNILRSLGFEGL